MRTALVTILAAALAAGFTAEAQTMVEYGALANKSSAAQHTLATKISNGMAKPLSQAEAAVDKSTPVAGRPQGVKGSPDKQAAPTPIPPALFILNNGERLESSHYVLSGGSLRIEIGDKERTIPLTAINRTATLNANHQRGLDLKIPANTSQITVSF